MTEYYIFVLTFKYLKVSASISATDSFDQFENDNLPDRLAVQAGCGSQPSR
jgi:hypothetical protein